VVDRDAGELREDDDRVLVLSCEFGGFLLVGEVEIPYGSPSIRIGTPRNDFIGG
jgi:hypothetical protein